MPPFQLRFLTLNTQEEVKGLPSTGCGPTNRVTRNWEGSGGCSTAMARIVAWPSVSKVVSLTVCQCDDKMPSTMTTAVQQRVSEIQQALRDGEIDGWLFYDFRGSDPLAYRVLQLDPTIHVTRRWYYWIPAEGVPVKLLHRIAPHVLDALPGQADHYVSWEQQRQILARLLAGGLRVAMQYSPLNAVPYVSRVDAGTIELIRSYEVEVVSSADLIQTFEARWTDRQLESHQFATAA